MHSWWNPPLCRLFASVVDNLYISDFLQAILAFLKKNNLKGTEEALKNELGKVAAKGVANVQQPDINEVKRLFPFLRSCHNLCLGWKRVGCLQIRRGPNQLRGGVQVEL